MTIDSGETKAYMAAIVESSDDAIIGKTLQGIITSWNVAAERIFGYTPEEAIGQHISMLIPPERQDEEYIILGKVKAGERIEHFDTIRRAKDGKLINISLTVSPIKNDKGVIVGASKVARDTTAAKNAERLTAYLAAIVDSSDDAIISKNLDGVITSWNFAAERVFGYTSEEAVGKHITLLIPADKINEEYGIIAKVKAGERLAHFETIRRRKDGRLINVSLTVSPIKNLKGEIIGASKIARDITEKKKTEEALRLSNIRKDEFLANISHELRTPMNAVIGLSNILGMSTSLSDKEKQFVSTLKQSADSLMVLINNLLDFSKYENGSFELEEIEFNLKELVDKTINLLSIKAREKNLPVILTYGENVRKYYLGDSLRIQQILMNLISNAVKFTEKGEIKINIKGDAAPENKTLLTIDVSDTGIGIPEEKIQIIFDKFTQADASTTRKFGGSGLGLTISRAFAEKMGGEIKVTSREGLGTTFTLQIPLRNSGATSVIESTDHVSEQGYKNVLVVDDYEPNIMVITAMLEMQDYTYDVATNGIEAIKAYGKNHYDVVLMDVQMHEMDGFESTRHIRKLEQEKSIARTPIIAMTAHVLEKDKNKCLEVGMDDFIPKPFEPHILVSKLKNLIHNTSN